MDCVWVTFRGWMGKAKYLSAFERGMVVGDRCTGLSVSRTAMLLGFPRSTASRVYQQWSTNQRTSSQQLWEALESTRVSIPVECFPHHVAHAPTNWFNIRKAFLMFSILRVHELGYRIVDWWVSVPVGGCVWPAELCQAFPPASPSSWRSHAGTSP